MLNIKPMEAITNKWRGRAQMSTEDYKNGILTTPKDWAALTTDAASSYTAGLQASLAAKRWESGIRKAGTAKWKQNASTKGPARWAEGISLSGDAYARGFAPYREVLAGLTLPPRGPRGDVKNYERSAAVGKALNAKRLATA